MEARDDGSKMDWLPVDSATPALIEQSRQRRSRQTTGNIVSQPLAGALGFTGEVAAIKRSEYPDVLLQAAVVALGAPLREGQIVEAVAIPWFEILEQLARDPEFLFKVPWRKQEEIIAAAYHRAGWHVVLTPRSGDKGRDIIATHQSLSIRLVDQIKAYKAGHLVTADEVRSMLGVLQVDRNVSKGLVTTTSRFAPRIAEEEGLRDFMPFRLELRDGIALRKWLLESRSDGPLPP